MIGNHISVLTAPDQQVLRCPPHLGRGQAAQVPAHKLLHEQPSLFLWTEPGPRIQGTCQSVFLISSLLNEVIFEVSKYIHAKSPILQF